MRVGNRLQVYPKKRGVSLEVSWFDAVVLPAGLPLIGAETRDIDELVSHLDELMKPQVLLPIKDYADNNPSKAGPPPIREKPFLETWKIMKVVRASIRYVGSLFSPTCSSSLGLSGSVQVFIPHVLPRGTRTYGKRLAAKVQATLEYRQAGEPVSVVVHATGAAATHSPSWVL